MTECLPLPHETSTRFLRWLREEALPVWAAKGRSPSGGSVENLSWKGHHDPTLSKRVRVQLRQIYVYAEATRQGWYNGERFVSDIFDFLWGRALSDQEGGCAYLLSPDGTVLDARRDLYDQAFLIFAMATAYAAFGEPRYKAAAESAIDFINNMMRAPSGGWVERVNATCTAVRRQNPHMHLFEASLALYAATGSRQGLAVAEEIKALFDAHFYRSETGVILEYFETDWTPLTTGGVRRIEPGHMAEWAVLLARFDRVTGADNHAVCTRLLDEALLRGLNARTGLLYDEVSVAGEILLPTHRTWPQTELIRALCVFEAQEHISKIERATQALMMHFCAPAGQGLWRDQVSHDGTVLRADAPASTLYHLMGTAIALTDWMAR